MVNEGRSLDYAIRDGHYRRQDLA